MGSDLRPELVEFLCSELQVGRAKIRGDSQLVRDLGVDGDDGLDLIEAFARKFGVDFAGFDCTRHFGPERIRLAVASRSRWQEGTGMDTVELGRGSQEVASAAMAAEAKD